MSERTVVVVDDNADFRQSTEWMLEASGYRVHGFGLARRALHWLGEASADEPRCCLLDVRMPGMDGLGLHDALNERGVRVPVIYMTGHADVPLAVEAMKKGAVTFLEKPFAFDALERALRSAFGASRQAVPDADAERLRAFREALGSLTPRESEVMREIALGKANKVAAAELGISVKTVEVHRTRLMKKLSVRSGPELVRLAMSCR